MKVKELCTPVAKTNIDPLEQDAKGATRTTSCTVVPAVVSEPNVALLCWQAKAASHAYAQPWDGVDKGTKVAPKQAKAATRTVFVGHQLVAPERVDTSEEAQFCLPVSVTGLGTVVP